MATLDLQPLTSGRTSFMQWVDEFRPGLHRYCARMMGSAIDGEDVVQEALAKAYYQLSLSVSVPELKPWLLRIAHNTALDHLKRYERVHAEPLDDRDDLAANDDSADPASVRAALGSFLQLPVLQRSAVILKDVLGFSNDEIAGTLKTTVPAVKSALARGRGTLRAAPEATHEAPALTPTLRATLDQYVSRFNARDWDGLRALLAAEVELDVVARASRRNDEVSQYFGNYAKENVTLQLGMVDRHVVLGVFGPALLHVIRLTVAPDGISFIRDYRYARYMSDDVVFTPLL